MRKSILLTAVLSTLSLTNLAHADEAAAPAAEAAPPYTLAYNVGLYSQYVFRGLTQTGEDLALQGGVDFTHSSGFYLGTWASNISWLEDAAAYKHSSLELDLYGGFASTIGDTGIGYNVGLLQYVYPGDTNTGFADAETTEIYGSLSYQWISAKLSVAVSNDVFGITNADGTYYAELNANYPIGETGLTVNAHVGRQDYSGSGNDKFSYTDWKLGLTKSWSNGINLGAYYTDTNANQPAYTDASGQYLGDKQFTVFVQKTF
jgi:uncharacterized protein (TIGR02001 family)